MGAHLDLDDVASGHPMALEELAKLRRAAARYEKVRLMNPQQWAAAFRKNITTGKPFDAIIDEWPGVT